MAYRFICGACKQEHARWEPRCRGCGEPKVRTATAEEMAAQAAPAASSADQVAPQEFAIELARPRLMIARAPEPELEEELADLDPSEAPIPISEIAEATFVRESTGLAPLDLVLGGGLVKASVALLASPPGVGKSSLTLQMLVGLGHRCLYATGEETREQLAATARRIGAVSDKLYVVAENKLAKIFAHARSMRAQTIAIDSIQKVTCDDVNGRAGSTTQLKECTARLVHFAKTTDTTLWLIGHVTSDGDIAGPKTVEHDVDVVLELEQGAKFEGRERLLKCVGKNRFGQTNITGYFQLTSEGFVPVDPDGWDEEL
jgi:DNA repair protein RadA/Sms